MHRKDKNSLDIFENRYFYLSKWLLVFIGAWPYSSKRKMIRNLWFCLSVIMSLPTLIGMMMHFSVPIRLLEHIVVFLHILVMFAKLLTLSLFEKKVKVMFEITAENWKIITDNEEKKILINYSNRGRYLTIAYSLFVTAIFVCFITFPQLPPLLYKMKLLSTPQHRMSVMNGEYLVEDRDSYYWQIYLFDSIASLAVVVIYLSTDVIYRVCTEQCFALYAIITHRLVYLRTKENSTTEDNSFNQLVQIIKLHQRTLKFNQSLQEAFSGCISIIMLANVIEIPLSCNMIIMTLHDDPIFCFRIISVVITMFAHLLWFYWLGQKHIDHSSRLSFDAYSTDWYQFPKESQTLLKIFMLRCREPVYITAGGLINISMKNYASIIRKALSYSGALLSFNK